MCKGQHTHVFYCELYYTAALQGDRVKVAQKLQTCFPCLRMDSRVDFSNRAQWRKNHSIQCQSEWVCKIDDCNDRPAERQYHMTLCRWHEDENKKIQADFIKNLDKNQVKPGISFFFNIPQFFSLNPLPEQVNLKVAGIEVLHDVQDPSIFMLQNVVVNDRTLLTFYDSGCLGSALSDRAAQILESVCVREGPTKMSVAGGKTVTLEGGDEQFLLDLVEPKTKATITGLRMPHVTTPFPVWDISLAWENICAEHRKISPDGPPLPPTPGKIGGVEVDIMIGIRYQKYFPELIVTLPSGLGVFKSKIGAPRGEITILAGPHPAWRHAVEVSGFMGASSFFTAETRALRCETSTLHHLYHPVEHLPVDTEEDDVLDDPLDPDLGCYEECLTEHCEKHGDFNQWIIPMDWNLDHTIYSLRNSASKFSEAKHVGSEVPY